MKVSLSWIFDHIASHKMHDFDVYELVKSLRGMPAEIEHVEKIVTNWDDVSMCKVVDISTQDAPMVVLESAEWRKKITIPQRSDERIGSYFLIKRTGKDAYAWAALTDFGSTKHGLVPELYCSQEDFAGAWKKTMPAHDYILSMKTLKRVA